MQNLPLGPSDLSEGEARIVPVPTAPAPWRSIVVTRQGDRLVAYWNVCRHLPIPLDAGSGSLPRGGEWVCSTHGARFRAADGLCLSGPCAGRALFPVPVEERDGQLAGRLELPKERADPVEGPGQPRCQPGQREPAPPDRP